MSLFDKVRKAAKEVGKKAVEEAQKYAAEIQLQRKKAKLLSLLKKKELIDLAFNYDVPVSKGMTKQDIASSLSKIKKLTKRKIQNIVRKKKGIERISEATDVMEVEQEITRTEKIKTRVRRVSRIERKIERELGKFKPMVRGRFRERNLENQLYIWLQRPFDDVDYQVPCKKGKIDIAIDGRYGIELKMAASPAQLHGFLGQVFVYSKEFEKVYLLIYDTRGNIKPANIRELKGTLKEMGATNVKVLKKP